MIPTARDLLSLKNSVVVFTCSPETPVRDACRMMRDRRVGSLVVVRGAEVQGLLTERDVVKRVVAEGVDPSASPVRDVMEREVATASLEAGCDEIEALLRRRRARYVPIVGARGLLGMVSLGDIARFHVARERALARNVFAAEAH
jgi:CBS domain-containing protein